MELHQNIYQPMLDHWGCHRGFFNTMLILQNARTEITDEQIYRDWYFSSSPLFLDSFLCPWPFFHPVMEQIFDNFCWVLGLCCTLSKHTICKLFYRRVSNVPCLCIFPIFLLDWDFLIFSQAENTVHHQSLQHTYLWLCLILLKFGTESQNHWGIS